MNRNVFFSLCSFVFFWRSFPTWMQRTCFHLFFHFVCISTLVLRSSQKMRAGCILEPSLGLSKCSVPQTLLFSACISFFSLSILLLLLLRAHFFHGLEITAEIQISKVQRRHRVIVVFIMYVTAWVMSNYIPTHGACLGAPWSPFIFIWLDTLNFPTFYFEIHTYYMAWLKAIATQKINRFVWKTNFNDECLCITAEIYFDCMQTAVANLKFKQIVNFGKDKSCIITLLLAVEFSFGLSPWQKTKMYTNNEKTL